MSPPKVAMKVIRSWTKKTFGVEYKNKGDALVHGNQNNYTDCGILAANTVAHDIFGDELWVPGNQTLERLRWFLCLGNLHIEHVCIILLTYKQLNNTVRR